MPSGASRRVAPYLSEQSNPWGRTVNLDGPHSDGVRRHIIDSMLMWLRDYHVDGLRLDAVHAMPDSRATHWLEQAAVEVEALSTHLGRPLSLIAESDLNDPTLITAREAGGYGLHAREHDSHHALHTSHRGKAGTTATSAPSILRPGADRRVLHTGVSSFQHRSHGGPSTVSAARPRFRAYGSTTTRSATGRP